MVFIVAQTYFKTAFNNKSIVEGAFQILSTDYIYPLKCQII